MERKSYTYAMKLTGLLLHEFFTVVLTVGIFLLSSLFDRNILAVTDIATEDFLNSGYYTRCIEQKCKDLSEYLLLLQKGGERTAEEEKSYLQYNNEFYQEEKNFCFWYQINGVWYTNQPDREDWQDFDVQAVSIEAKNMGDYLIYNMEDKTFSTNIYGLADSFFGGYNSNMYWPLENVVLVIGVDTDFTVRDDLYDANNEYMKLRPWIKVSIVGVLLGAIGWILTLVYLTIASGHRDGEEGIHLHWIDKVKVELVIAAFILVASELVLLVGHVNNKTWNVSGLLVAYGTVGFLIDNLFLVFYLSMVRRMKAEVMWENSLACWLSRGIGKTFRERTVTVRVLVTFGIHMVVCFVLAVGAFYFRNVVAFFLLLVFSGGEAYLLLREAVERSHVLNGVERIRDGALEEKIDVTELHGENRKLAEAVNHIGAGLLHVVDDNTKNERMKADLITNVSHDIKTPLTSIINYVNLLRMEDIENERARNYIQILDEKSQRLKQLTVDLVEASRISSGNVKLDMQKIDIVELVYQTGGEFNEKFEAKELTIVTKLPQTAVFIRADGRQLYRAVENLYNNVAKYALEKTRVYVGVTAKEEEVVFSIKNVSERSLAQENSNAGDLTERFTRGDSSRTTEGSGLGLSIAKNLTQLMGGEFQITVDGDLFIATIVFPLYRGED
ncbi:MAG: sensor histidine kinase [Roseburia sp.]